MKKITQLLLILCLASFGSNTLFAQSKYASIHAGYGFKSSSQNLEYFEFYNTTMETNSFTDEQVYVSLGKGLNIGGNFGYMFNKNIGIDLGLNYLIGGKSKCSSKSPFSTAEETMSSKMLRIIPSLVIATDKEKTMPYAKLGLLIGSGSVTCESKNEFQGKKNVYKGKLNGGLALGLTSSVGVTFNADKKMSMFGELTMVNLSYAPTKAKLTEFNINGIDELPNMTTNEKETVFVDSITEDFNSPPPSIFEPSTELKQKLPFGSIGLNFGLRFNL